MDKDTYVDPDTGEKYKLSDFDERRSWTKVKKKKAVKSNAGGKVNILERV